MTSDPLGLECVSTGSSWAARRGPRSNYTWSSILPSEGSSIGIEGVDLICLSSIHPTPATVTYSSACFWFSERGVAFPRVAIREDIHYGGGHQLKAPAAVRLPGLTIGLYRMRESSVIPLRASGSDNGPTGSLIAHS